MLRWYSVDYSDEANRSPLFLAAVELVEKTNPDGERHDYVIKPKVDGLRINPALRKSSAAERGISLPADDALSLDEIDAAFASVYESLRGFDRWTIQQDIVLGIFDFTKFSLYSDLERNRSQIKSDPIIQALNGDMKPIREAEGDITTPTATELDDVVDPIDTYQVLDADSSQQEAIEAAKRGKSFVLQGPPGTGKSQTISNIIAEKLAAGERVLFVSEKQAALDVVKIDSTMSVSPGSVSKSTGRKPPMWRSSGVSNRNSRPHKSSQPKVDPNSFRSSETDGIRSPIRPTVVLLAGWMESDCLPSVWNCK